MKYNYEPKPPKEASFYFAAKKLKPSFDYQDVWGKEHAASFTVARTTQIDVLSDIYSALKTALDEGQTFETFQKNLEPVLVKKGWWGVKEQTDPQTGEVKKVKLGTPRRLKTIFWANMSTARSAGQWERAQRTKTALPYLLYTQTSSADPRPEHLTWVGTILPIDHEWWHTHYPSNGWGCNCGVRQISKIEAQRLGGVTKPINFPPKPFRRKLPNGDYETIIVPGGIDPGWDSNPGRARMAETRKARDRAVAKARNAQMPDNLVKSILSGAKIANASEQTKWLETVFDGGAVAKGEHTLPIDVVSTEVASRFEELGFMVDEHLIALDYSLVRHAWKGHGSGKDKRVNQIPLTANDLLLLPQIIEAGNIDLAKLKNSPRYVGHMKPRFKSVNVIDGYEYTVILELRLKKLIPVTMYKKKV